MKTISIQDFGNGIADDYTHGGVGEASITKQFDILSYPKRLQPLRGMTTDTADTGIGNLLTLSTDGYFYGLGWLTANNAIANLWTRSSGAWVAIGGGVGATGIYYNLFVEFPQELNGETLIMGYGGTTIKGIKPSDGSNSTSKALTFTALGQGFVHQQYQTLFFPYKNGTTISAIASLASGAAVSSITAPALTLPKQYSVDCLTNYGNYLAIPAYNANGISVNTSMLYLWDTTSATWNEQINWGAGQLKVLNNLNGTLIGISSESSSAIDDSASITIKGYDGGTEPYLIKEITATRMTSTPPSVTINQRVNFIYKNRLYFSVNIVNGGNAPARYGLWSVGKNKSGRWTVVMERVATNTNTDTGVLAAVMSGSLVSMVHTAVGTLTVSASSAARDYGATSVYESTINPEMDELDRDKQKQLVSVWVTCLPLSDINTGNSTIVMKYRVDNRAESGTDSSSWTTIFTKTSNSPVTTGASDTSNSQLTFFESTKPSSGQFQAGRKYEFRLESTNGAIITGWGYKYETLQTNI